MAWQFDPNHSIVAFENRYLGILTVRGRFKKAALAVTLDEEDLARSSLVATIDLSSVDTDNERRDDTLRAESYFDVAKYPDAVFTSKRIQKQGARYRVVGDLALHGVTREIELDAEFGGEGADSRGIVRKGFSATATVLRSDFGIHTDANESVTAPADEIKLLLDIALMKVD